MNSKMSTSTCNESSVSFNEEYEVKDAHRKKMRDTLDVFDFIHDEYSHLDNFSLQALSVVSCIKEKIRTTIIDIKSSGEKQTWLIQTE